MKLCEGVIKFIKLTWWSKEYMKFSLAICGSSVIDRLKQTELPYAWPTHP